MNKKYLLLALAAPALFAACTQEDIVSNVPSASTELLGKVAGEVDFVFNNGSATRMTWAPDGDAAEAIEWNPNGDAFSLFWLNDTTNVDVYTGYANALYETKDGFRFSSRNILYEGKHVMVYPAATSHVSAKQITVSVPEPQSDKQDLGTYRTVAVSEVLDIMAPLNEETYDKVNYESPEAQMDTLTARYGTIWAGGLGHDVNDSINVLSSHMVLNLNFNLRKLDQIQVEKVVLKSNNQIFATAGTLSAKEGVVSMNATAIASEITLNVSDVLINAENKSYTAQISLLPPVVASLEGATYAIEVYTNYGKVTVNQGADVTNAKGVAQLGTDSIVVDDKNVINPRLNFDAEFTNIGTLEGGEKAYGHRIVRNVNVDMANTSIENWEVEDYNELMAAYEMYDKLERGASEDPDETFVLVGKKKVSNQAPTYFEITPAVAEEMAKHDKVSLAKGTNLAEIRLIGGHTSAPALKEVASKDNIDLYMTSVNTWSLNVKQAANIMGWKKFENQGNVTLTSAQNVDKNSTAITTDDLTAFTSNGGSIKLNYAADYTDNIAYTTLNGTKISNVANLKLNGSSTFDGVFDVTGSVTLGGTIVFKNTLNVGDKDDLTARVIVAAGTTTLQGTTNVYGSLLATTNATLINDNTVNVSDAKASIIITKQSATKVINLKSRHDNVRVSDAANQGYIKWVCDAETLTKDATDVFNYVILDDDINWVQNKVIDYIEVRGAKVEVTGNATDVDTKGLQKVVIGSNSTLVIPTGSIMETDEVTGGYVEVYGTFSTGNLATTNTTIYDFSDN